MDFLGWTAAVGGLLLLMSLASGWIHRGPITSFGLYLVAGIICGPWVLDLLQIDIVKHATLASHITEIAMAASLFITGLKLRLPLRAPDWRVGMRLAFPAMLLTVAGVAVVAHFLAHFDWPLSLAFGAIVAPTDPVLASLISVNDARDNDSLRVALSSEAGMNDGSALPLLMLAMLMIVSEQPLSLGVFAHWAAVDVIWALAGGIAIGFGMGRLIGVLTTHLRSAHQDIAPNDFLALALIALSYAAAQAVDASGFLATFAAGVGLRRAELRVMMRHPPENLPEDDQHPPAEMLVDINQRHRYSGAGLTKSVGLVVGDALSFGDTIERLLAAGMVLILGVTLAHHWNLTGLLIAAILFLLIRPAAVYLTTIGTGMPRMRRLLIGWLGIRGIGSINYIAFASMHGLAGADAQRMVDMAFTLVVASIVVHGITVTPLENRRQAWLLASRQRQDSE
ncbi:cation:proton antiporter [Winslowiella iniecta]|uniref:Sodium:proton antiporter n=1 Tax=Winslowiella iniecta TaxID=1560201 RepID=A0A0L7T873_9GAMM|nr:cation:proton antiporter [Winslowiella iniecta]KOC91573.1 sodium:proton antiporter [Winslowiella iniecta]KOC94475.1 sodium:proton antiporter [Winslowiella iniecta]